MKMGENSHQFSTMLGPVVIALWFKALFIRRGAPTVAMWRLRLIEEGRLQGSNATSECASRWRLQNRGPGTPHVTGSASCD